MTASDWPPPPSASWVLDMDGVVWLAGEMIPGSREAITELRRIGARVTFATNNSTPTLSTLSSWLERGGVDVDPADLLTSGQAAAGMLEPGSRALVLAGDGAREAMSARGIEIVTGPPADAVVVGWSATFDVAELTTAMRSVRSGARLIGTNEDATYPTPNGLLPGSGSFLAAVATASGKHPEVAGKPHAPLADLVRARLGQADVVVGDRPSTDGALAHQLGAAYALVYSGVTSPGDDPGAYAPTVTAPDLNGLVRGIGATSTPSVGR